MHFNIDPSNIRYNLEDPNREIIGHDKFSQPIAISKDREIIAVAESRTKSWGIVKGILHALGLYKYDIGFVVKNRATGEEKYATDLTTEDYKKLGFNINDSDVDREMPFARQGRDKVVKFLANIVKPSPLPVVQRKPLFDLRAQVNKDLKTTLESSALKDKFGKENINKMVDDIRKIPKQDKPMIGSDYEDLNKILIKLMELDETQLNDGDQITLEEKLPRVSASYDAAHRGYEIELSLNHTIFLGLK